MLEVNSGGSGVYFATKYVNGAWINSYHSMLWRQRKSEQTQMVSLKYYFAVSVDGEEAPALNVIPSLSAHNRHTCCCSCHSFLPLFLYLAGFSWLVSSAFFSDVCLYGILVYSVLSESHPLFFSSWFYCLRQFWRIFSDLAFQTFDLDLFFSFRQTSCTSDPYRVSLKSILKCNLFLWWQSWIFSIIIPVFSITWSFRNY